MTAESIAILGGGKIGEALLSGLLRGHRAAADIVISEKHPERASYLTETFGVQVLDVGSAVKQADTLVIAVKPQDIDTLLAEMAEGVATRHVVVSVAAGSHATDDHLGVAEALLGSVGRVVRVPENQLDAVTALSGSGPAYFFYLVEAMIDAGILLGLPRALAAELIVQTAIGAAVMLRDSGEHPVQLREAVTSPGGTTIAAIRELEVHGVRAALLAAIEAAARRSRELGAEDS